METMGVIFMDIPFLSKYYLLGMDRSPEFNPYYQEERERKKDKRVTFS
jgi:hypothetical protein